MTFITTIIPVMNVINPSRLNHLAAGTEEKY